MVLTELGSKITASLKKFNNSTIIDQTAMDEVLKYVCNAMISADININIIKTLRDTIKKKLNIELIASGLDKRRIVFKTLFDEIVKILDPGVIPFKPRINKSNIIMLVGLQGSGKTTTVTKLASHYKRKSFRTALVCADTFRAGAFDQLSQNATRAKIPFFGSHVENDPVKIAQDGVNKFIDAGYDMIIVDTSGRNKQDIVLFEEMKQVADVIKPNLIIFVIDASIGQMALDQVKTFKSYVDIGAVIITKMDGHAKGGGALSAVATSKSPIIFLGTGEGITDLQEFNIESFVSRLLGMGDMTNMINKIKEVMPNDLSKNIQDGKFSLRDMYEQLKSIQQMGSLSELIDMFPGMDSIKKSGCDLSQNMLKKYMVIMDSMTNQELDNPKILNVSRINRIARGSGTSIEEVNGLHVLYKQFEKLAHKMKGIKSSRNINQNLQNMIPSQLLNKMGGINNISKMMKQMEKKI